MAEALFIVETKYIHFNSNLLVDIVSFTSLKPKCFFGRDCARTLSNVPEPTYSGSFDSCPSRETWGSVCSLSHKSICPIICSERENNEYEIEKAMS